MLTNGEFNALATGIFLLSLIVAAGFFGVFSKLNSLEKKTVAEIDDLKAAVTSAISELASIASQLQALEGTTPAPGVLEGLATQLNAAVTAAQAAVAPPAAPAAGSTTPAA